MKYGEENGVDNRKEMMGFYRTLKEVDVPSSYKVAVITRACPVLKSREKGRKRGREAEHRTPLRPTVCVTSGFFTTVTGKLFISLGHDKYEIIQLNRYVRQKIAEPEVKVRSLTVTADSIALCYSREVKPVPVRTIYGVDRNERNLTFGNTERVVRVDISKIMKVRQTTREIVGSFVRNDVRIRKEISSKYWRRANNRSNQILHGATNFIVRSAAEGHAALALEDLTGINRMYRSGNGRGPAYRFRLNSWPHRKAYGMMEYKSAWKGLTVIRLSKAETRGSSSAHMCGDRLRNPGKDNVGHWRMLWCPKCKVWVDRDVNASIVISERGLARFASSLPRRAARKLLAGEKGPAGEAMSGNRTTPVILRVDAGKRSSTEDTTEPFTISCSGSPGA